MARAWNALLRVDRWLNFTTCSRTRGHNRPAVWTMLNKPTPHYHTKNTSGSARALRLPMASLCAARYTFPIPATRVRN